MTTIREVQRRLDEIAARTLISEELLVLVAFRDDDGQTESVQTLLDNIADEAGETLTEGRVSEALLVLRKLALVELADWQVKPRRRWVRTEYGDRVAAVIARAAS